MKTVLVPLDGSELSEDALKVAAPIVRAVKDGRLLLLRALETPRLSAWLPAEMMSLHQHEREMVASYLETKKQELEQQGLDVETILAPGPGPVDAVICECREGRADMVVMSSHGESGWVQYFLGSNAEKIARLVPTRILIVKGKKEVALPFNKILIPLDGSDLAQKAIPQAMDVSSGEAAEILLVGVSVAFKGHAFEGDIRAVVEPDVKRIQAYLNEQADWLRNQGYQVETLVRQGDPSNEILEAAKEENTDLILMARKGRSGLAKLFFSSVAETVLRSSSCSVMIV